MTHSLLRVCCRGMLTATLVGASATPLLPVVVASAHPSDFRTLTLEFRFGSLGSLDVIEGAMVPAAGPSYEPFPTAEQKLTVAVDVLAALGVPTDTVQIDAAVGDLYHEVGFTVRFSKDRAPGGDLALRIDSHPLQQIAEATHLDRLKLSICSVDGGVEALRALNIRASRAGNDEGGCTVWRLAPTDDPVALSVGSADALAYTGGPSASQVRWTVATAFALILIGVVYLKASDRLARR